MEEGVNLDELKGLKTLGLQIGIGISKCLMHLMYFFTHKEEAAESEEKLEIVITDSRFQSFRNSIPELLVSLSWLRKEDDLVSKKLVPLLHFADGQLAGLIGCRRDDKIFQLLAKEGLDTCLGQLELLILNVQSAFGVPIFAADDSAKLPLACLQDHLSKLERGLRGIELQLSNYEEILCLTDKLAFRNLARFMRFMDDKIIGLWKDLVGKPPVKAVCGLTTSRGLIEGPFQDFVADATRYLEESKSTFCTEFGEAIGSVFAARDPDVQQIEYFLHATFAAAKSFSDFYVETKASVELSKSFDRRKQQAFVAQTQKMMVRPPKSPEAVNFKMKVKALWLHKQLSFLKIVEQVKEAQAVSNNDLRGLAKEIHTLELEASQLGMKLRACFLRMLIMMKSEGNLTMINLFNKYHSLLDLVSDILHQATPSNCVGFVLGKVNHLLTKGQVELNNILTKRKLSNIFVTTEWLPTIRIQQIDSTLDDLLEVTTRMDLLLTLPMLPDAPKSQTLDWIAKELNDMKATLAKVEEFIVRMYNVFQINQHLKDVASVDEFLEIFVRPELVNCWKQGN
ncbi:hypothetical protein RchiOBHm_Chr5g0015831 [Rosa chinensis]|nr:hypothetical protein RchiOBHm_Chr5g0015831 [Rosa chinensis]